MLIVNSQGIFGVYSSRSVQEYSQFYAIEEGADYALGILSAIYDQMDSAQKLVEKALLTWW
jgi:ATP-dependent protease HslVU (ClpYQ) peptidase subunit